MMGREERGVVVQLPWPSLFYARRPTWRATAMDAMLMLASASTAAVRETTPGRSRFVKVRRCVAAAPAAAPAAGAPPLPAAAAAEGAAGETGKDGKFCDGRGGSGFFCESSLRPALPCHAAPRTFHRPICTTRGSAPMTLPAATECTPRATRVTRSRLA